MPSSKYKLPSHTHQFIIIVHLLRSLLISRKRKNREENPNTEIGDALRSSYLFYFKHIFFCLIACACNGQLTHNVNVQKS